MAGGESFNMAEEFVDVDFNGARLEKRLVRTMETLSMQPGKSIWAGSGNRAEAKAVYNMAENEKFDRNEILRAHREGTIKRMADEPVILAVQDRGELQWAAEGGIWKGTDTSAPALWG
jgi:hypothetical protein